MKAREQQVMGNGPNFSIRGTGEGKGGHDEKGHKMEQLKFRRYFAQLPESQNAQRAGAFGLAAWKCASELTAMSRSQHKRWYLQSLLADSPVVG